MCLTHRSGGCVSNGASVCHVCVSAAGKEMVRATLEAAERTDMTIALSEDEGTEEEEEEDEDVEEVETGSGVKVSFRRSSIVAIVFGN